LTVRLTDRRRPEGDNALASLRIESRTAPPRDIRKDNEEVCQLANEILSGRPLHSPATNPLTRRCYTRTHGERGGCSTAGS